MLKKTIVGLTIGAMSVGSSGTEVEAEVIYESAVLGPTGQTNGLAISSDQFLGARFQIDSLVDVTGVGGDARRSASGPR